MLFNTLRECDAKVTTINLDRNLLDQTCEISMDEYIENNKYIKRIETGMKKERRILISMQRDDLPFNNPVLVRIVDKTCRGTVFIERAQEFGNLTEIIDKMARSLEKKVGFPYPLCIPKPPHESISSLKTNKWRLNVFSINDKYREFPPLSKLVELTSDVDLKRFKDGPFKYMVMDYKGDGICWIYVVCQRGKKKENELSRYEGFRILLGHLLIEKLSVKLFTSAIDARNKWDNIDIIKQYPFHLEFKVNPLELVIGNEDSTENTLKDDKGKEKQEEFSFNQMVLVYPDVPQAMFEMGAHLKDDEESIQDLRLQMQNMHGVQLQYHVS